MSGSTYGRGLEEKDTSTKKRDAELSCMKGTLYHSIACGVYRYVWHWSNFLDVIDMRTVQSIGRFRIPVVSPHRNANAQVCISNLL